MVSVDVTSTFDGNGSVNPSWSHVCTGANLLLVLLPRWPNNAVTAVTYNGVSMTKAADNIDDGNQDRVDIWCLLNPTPGSNTIAVTCSGVTGRVGAISVIGADPTSNPVGYINNGTGTTVSVNVPTSSSDLVFGAMTADGAGAGTPTIPGAQTSHWAGVFNFQSTAASRQPGTGTTLSHQYTITSTLWGVAAVCVKSPSPAVPPTLPANFPHPPMRDRST